MDSRHAFQILEQLGPEADRLGIKVVDAYGQSGPVSEFLPKIVRYIEAREAEIELLRGTVTQHCSLNFTLTDEEREAVAGAADLLIGSKPGAILRNLLKRLHT
jgi:hypothetical protein